MALADRLAMIDRNRIDPKRTQNAPTPKLEVNP